MSVSLAPPMFLQFMDPNNSGSPAVGFKLFTYAAGTSTKQSTWTDSTQVTQLPNPIVLDANGAVQCWGDPSKGYKFVLCNPNDSDPPTSPLRTTDNLYFPITAGAGVPSNFPQTPAELAVGVTPTNGQYPQGWVRRYGAVLDGTTDCTPAMIQATAVAGFITVDGPMALSSASLSALPNKALTLISNTTITALAGAYITITGNAACNVFYSTDQSYIQFIDVWCTGNGSSSGTATTGFFWYIKATAAAVAEQVGHKFTRGGLTNFSGLYWIYLDNTAASNPGFAISGFVCDGSKFTSLSGNAQTPSDIQVTASVFGFSGSDTVTAFFSIKDCVVRNCTADGTHIKNFLYFWSGVFRCKAHGLNLVGFGTGSEFTNDTGCYALAAYDHSHGAALAPDEIEFYDNLIDGVRDCGVYVAVANRIEIYDMQIRSQTSTANTVIPKGAIACNSAVYATVSDIECYNCAIGIAMLQSSTTAAPGRIRNITMHALPNNSTGLILSGSTASLTTDIGVNNLFVQAGGNTNIKAVLVNCTATVGINNLEIVNFDINGCTTGILVQAPDSSVPQLRNVRISNGRFRNISGTNFQFAGCTDSGQRVTVENLTFELLANAVGLYMQAMPGITVRNVVFNNMSSGSTFCWYGGSANGRLANLQYNNVAVNNRYDSSGSRMGVDAPGWTGNDNDFVQDLNITELGSAASKYVRLGWTWDRVAAAWKECRALTGN